MRIATVKIENMRGYWRVDFDAGDSTTIDGRMCLSQVIDWVIYDLSRNYNAPLRQTAVDHNTTNLWTM